MWGPCGTANRVMLTISVAATQFQGVDDNGGGSSTFNFICNGTAVPNHTFTFNVTEGVLTTVTASLFPSFSITTSCV